MVLFKKNSFSLVGADVTGEPKFLCMIMIILMDLIFSEAKHLIEVLNSMTLVETTSRVIEMNLDI